MHMGDAQALHSQKCTTSVGLEPCRGNYTWRICACIHHHEPACETALPRKHAEELAHVPGISLLGRETATG